MKKSSRDRRVFRRLERRLSPEPLILVPVKHWAEKVAKAREEAYYDHLATVLNQAGLNFNL